MEWREEGTVLRRRLHGETAALLDVLTAAQGRHVGLVPGGASARRAAMLQPGSRVMLHWRARDRDALGHFAVEPVRARAGLMADGTALAGLNAITALLVWALPERDPHPRIATALEALLDRIEAPPHVRSGGGADSRPDARTESRPDSPPDTLPDWAADYLLFEMLLLDELGFGLDLTSCAVTGRSTGLAYVSPVSGRAVTREGAGEYAPRLLALPRLLGGEGEDEAGDAEQLAQGLALTGHFLDTRVAAQLIGRPLPPARAALVHRLLHGRR